MSPGSQMNRQFLFLQGPPGPFFRLLAAELRGLGAQIYRVNLSGGDKFDWPQGSVDYRGRMKHWPLWFDAFLRDNAITDLVLYGDCRPVHQPAVRLAQLRGVHVHVFEEGYIRPDWMTLERDGVNGNSRLERDPEVIMASAQWLPPIPTLPPITADFRRRARDSYWHYHHVVTGKKRFPLYTTHREGSIIVEGLSWLWRFSRAPKRAVQAQQVLKEIKGRRYFLLPLQLTKDYQIRFHSPFATMAAAVDYVLESFSRHGPEGSLLLIKEHPFDISVGDWRRYLLRRARRLGIAGRVLHIDGGDLQTLSHKAAGVVCVNSTSGTLALECGTPVIVLGNAIYDVPGITHQGELDGFWSAPTKPDKPLYQAFKRMLHARCLVRGGLASESALRTLIDNSVAHLMSDDQVPPAVRQRRRQDAGTRPASPR
jgi:capsular polysaccharide export protein